MSKHQGSDKVRILPDWMSNEKHSKYERENLARPQFDIKGDLSESSFYIINHPNAIKWATVIANQNILQAQRNTIQTQKWLISLNNGAGLLILWMISATAMERKNRTHLNRLINIKVNLLF